MACKKNRNKYIQGNDKFGMWNYKLLAFNY